MQKYNFDLAMLREEKKQIHDIKIWLAQILLIQDSKFKYAVFKKSRVDFFFNQYCLVSTRPFIKKKFIDPLTCDIEGWESPNGEIFGPNEGKNGIPDYTGDTRYVPYTKAARMISRNEAKRLIKEKGQSRDRQA